MTSNRNSKSPSEFYRTACKPLTQEEFYEIILEQIEEELGEEGWETYSRTFKKTLSISLESCLVGWRRRLQKLDFSKVKEQIEKKKLVFHLGEVYEPASLIPEELAYYIIVRDKTLFFRIDCSDLYEIEAKFDIYDMREGYEGLLSYILFDNGNSLVKLIGKNPSNILKKIGKAIVER